MLSTAKFSLLCSFLLSCSVLFAQSVSINADNSDPDPSAMLDVKSTNKGMLIPRMNTADMNLIANAANGLLIFNTTTESFWFRKAGAWTELVSSQNNPTLIQDSDKDTKVQTEKLPDEDIIRFDLGGAEKWAMRGNRLEPKNGVNSVFIGNDVGNAGSNNVQLGYQAGKNASGNNNIFIGSGAGTNETGNNKIVIGTLLTGDQSTGLLKINNAYTLPATAGGAGQVLQATAGGNTNWATPASGLPAGTILAFAGPSLPTGFLLCNGASVNKALFPDLFAAIGTSWGGDGIPNFNLPDLRGQFLRGWSNGSGVDPDAGGRTALQTGGAIGDNVGSYQAHALQQHTHTYTRRETKWTTTDGNTNVWRNDAPYESSGANGANVSGNETRPKNAAVNYIIKY